MWLKKSFHTIVAFVILGIVLYCFIYQAILQDRATLNAEYILVEMTDESKPILAALSRCYVKSTYYNQRVTYRPVGSIFGDFKGQFVYCPDKWSFGRNAWVLTSSDDDPCNSNFYIISETTEAFDLLEVGAEQWYSDQRYRTLVSSVAMKEAVDCKDLLNIRNAFDGVHDEKCSIIQRPDSLPLYRIQTEEIQPKEYSNVALTHGVFMSQVG